MKVSMSQEMAERIPLITGLFKEGLSPNDVVKKVKEKHGIVINHRTITKFHTAFKKDGIEAEVVRSYGRKKAKRVSKKNHEPAHHVIRGNAHPMSFFVAPQISAIQNKLKDNEVLTVSKTSIQINEMAPLPE